LLAEIALKGGSPQRPRTVSQEICPVCGLPKDLCVCGELEKEQSKVIVKLETKRYGKPMTVIEGLDGKGLDLYDLTKQLKKKLACGGTVKNDSIMLQGDHRDRIRELLIEMGFKEDGIEVYRDRGKGISVPPGRLAACASWATMNSCG